MRNMIKNDEVNGGSLQDYPNEKYKQFFDKFKEIDIINVSDWKPVHVLSYFCKKYKEQYNINYKFKFNNPAPSKCFEVFQIKKLAMLLSSNPTILKNYIDWIFLNKVVKAKRRLTSISFMTNDGVVNEYKVNVLLSGDCNNNISRTTPLPENYKLIFQNIGTIINTYGELAFMSQITPLPQEMLLALTKIEELGFDKQLLDRIV